jgi:hypothetical protein
MPWGQYRTTLRGTASWPSLQRYQASLLLTAAPGPLHGPLLSPVPRLSPVSSLQSPVPSCRGRGLAIFLICSGLPSLSLNGSRAGWSPPQLLKPALPPRQRPTLDSRLHTVNFSLFLPPSPSTPRLKIIRRRSGFCNYTLTCCRLRLWPTLRASPTGHVECRRRTPTGFSSGPGP